MASDDSIPSQTQELQGTTSLYFPDYVQGEGWSVQLVLGNVDATAAATGDVVVYDQDGREISDLFDSGPRFRISAQGSRVLRSAGTGAIRRGWIEVRSESGSVWGLLTYRHSETGIEVGVAPVKPGDHFALFVEETSEVGTGLAIFKPEVAPEIELQVRDEGGNDPIGEVLTWGNFQQQALTLPEWFQAIDTTFLRDFRGLLFLRAPGADLFAPLGLRFGKEKRSLSAVPVIPVQDEGDGSSPNSFPSITAATGHFLYFPDYVEGDGWSVQLVLVNVGATAARVSVAAYGQDGHPVGELFESGSTYELAAQGSRVLRSTERSAIRRGWIEVKTGTSSVAGLLTYRNAETGIEVGVAPVKLGDHFALFVEETSEIGTGLAIFKPDASPEIELQLRDEGGNDPIGQVLTLRNFQQRALTLREWFQEFDTRFLRDFRGLLFLRAPDGDPFAPLGLRFGKVKGSLSAVPVIPIQPPDGGDPTPTGDRAALMALYEATDGPNWTRNDNWLSERPLGEWFGVRVDGQGRVIRLSLRENNLGGSLPPQLSDLAHLTVLDLARNGLTGPIPAQLGNLANLRHLILTNNGLAGPIPAELGSLSNLTRLWLSGNDLTGSIPEQLGNLTNLTILSLGNNDLTGPIPPQLGNLANLEVLVLDGNDLTGPIPVELCSLTNLEVLALSDNGLKGRLPMCLVRLPLNRFLYANTGLCAPVEEGFKTWLNRIRDHWGTDLQCAPLSEREILVALYDTTGGPNWTRRKNWLSDRPLGEWQGVDADRQGRVTGLSLRNNGLTGAIAPELAALSNLTVLDLSENGLTGSILPQLGNLANLEVLALNGNDLTGPIPAELCSLTSLEVLALSDNGLTGRLPICLTRLPLNRFLYANTRLCAPLENGFQTWLNSIRDHLGTGTQCAPLSDRDILVALYDTTGGPNWTRRTNWLSDRPLGEWQGVELDGQGRVGGLILANNGLTGPIPAELGSLSNLVILNLHQNALTGTIPAELGNLTELRALLLSENALTGTIPTELGDLTNLTAFWWDNNAGLCADELSRPWLDGIGDHRAGPYCGKDDRPALMALYHSAGGPNWTRSDNWGSNAPLKDWYGVAVAPHGRVAALDLSGNNLTGSIPSELGGLAGLRVVYLEENNLTGAIPPELGKLVNLQGLSLFANNLTGSIPSELGNLVSLEALWLQGNNLTGRIPPELGTLVSLEALSLAANNLTGQIPYSFLTLTLEAFDWRENPGLCARDTAGFRAWLDGIDRHYPGRYCVPERDVLMALYNSAGGVGWARSDNWGSNAPLDDWYGVATDDNGHITELGLEENGLTGTIPTELANLPQLEVLNLRVNRLTGQLPDTFLHLTLKKFEWDYNDTLCAPDTAVFRAWLSGIGAHVPGPYCATERELLMALYNSTDGPNWTRSDNWGSGAPLEAWHGVTLNAAGRVRSVDLRVNGLTGPIPPELGGLGSLEILDLAGNGLTGGIPAELGRLTSLIGLLLDENPGLSGPIPETLIALGELQALATSGTRLCVPDAPDYLEWRESIRDGFARLCVARLEIVSGGGQRAALGRRLPRPVIVRALGANGTPVADAPVTFTAVEDHGTADPEERETNRSGEARTVWTLGSAVGEQTLNVDSAEKRSIRVPATAFDPDALVAAIELVSGGGQEGAAGTTLPVRIAVRAVDSSGSPVEGAAVIFRPEAGHGSVYPSEVNTSGRGQADATWTLGVGDIDQTLTATVGAASAKVRATALYPQRTALEALYHATGGMDWKNKENWLTEAPLADWFGVSVDQAGNVVSLSLYNNGLRGRIPPAVGTLRRLDRLDLRENQLVGEIPPELGNLGRLRFLLLSNNQLAGAIPSELGNFGDALLHLFLSGNQLAGAIPDGFQSLRNLRILQLASNQIVGAVPAWLGSLRELRTLDLQDNLLEGSLPRTLGSLANLEDLIVSGNRLSGRLPNELGRLRSLFWLDLSDNMFSGAVPPEFILLRDLWWLNLERNPDLSGPLPAGLARHLNSLKHLKFVGTALCAPRESRFTRWLVSLETAQGRFCGLGEAWAHLTQAIQDRHGGVALVAGESALLRVFLTKLLPIRATRPRVRATFFVKDEKVYEWTFPASSVPIRTTAWQSDLDESLNWTIPGRVIQPGLEMVVEIDPDGTLDPALGVPRRFPTKGRYAVKVRRAVPVRLTLVPFIYKPTNDRYPVDVVESAGKLSWTLRDLNYLLPVGELNLYKVPSVLTDSRSSRKLMWNVWWMRTRAGNKGYWMGLTGDWLDKGGIAWGIGGDLFAAKVAVAKASWPAAVAHEFGHNLGLKHAPCGNPRNVDRSFSPSNGSSGIWGYHPDSLFGRESMVPPDRGDLMSYCGPRWISRYQYDKAQRRLQPFLDRLRELVGSPSSAATKSLLVSGGVGTDGTPYLDPAFVVDVPPALPAGPGPYRLEGRRVDGSALFSIAFGMADVPDGDGQSVFGYALPVQSGWDSELASLVLLGPGGSFEMREGSEPPIVIARDAATGDVRAILHEAPDLPADPLAQSDIIEEMVRARLAAAESRRAATVDEGVGVGAPRLEVMISRGLPGAADWRR